MSYLDDYKGRWVAEFNREILFAGDSPDEVCDWIRDQPQSGPYRMPGDSYRLARPSYPRGSQPVLG